MRATVPLLVAVTAAACGSSTLSSPDRAPVRTVVSSGQFSALPSGEGGNDPLPATRTVPFTIPAGGAMEATVNWGSAGNRFRVAFYPAGCTVGQLGFGACNPLLQGESNQKPAYIHLHALAGGSFTLGFLNLGPGTESGSYEVTLTN